MLDAFAGRWFIEEFLRQFLIGDAMFDVERPSRLSRWLVLRVPAGAKVEAVLLGGDFVRLATHFAKSTFLCTETEQCPACSVLPSRCYWYLPAVCVASRAPRLLELSSTASADLEQKAKFAGSGLTAGLRVAFSRRTVKSPVYSEILQQELKPSRATLAEWLTPLFAIYGLPPFRDDDSLATYSDRVEPMVLSRGELAVSRLKASCGVRASHHSR